MQRLRHGHAAIAIGPFQGRTTQGLSQQIVTQRRGQSALGLGVEHRYVLVPLYGRLQLAVGGKFAKGEAAQAFFSHLAFKQRTFGAGNPGAQE